MDTLKFMINENTAQEQTISLELSTSSVFSMVILPSGKREFHVIDQVGNLFNFWREIKRYSFDQIDSLHLCKNGVSQAKIEFPDGAILDMSLTLGYNPPYGTRDESVVFQDCFALTFSDDFDWTDHLVKEV